MSLHRRTIGAVLALALSQGAALTPGIALAQSYNVGHPAGERVAVDLSSDVAQTRSLSLPKGKSAVIDLPTDARDVIVSDPKVADVVLSTPRRIYVLGVAGGQTDAAFFDAGGRQLLRLNIRVDQDVSALGDTLNRILPGSSIRVEAVNQSIVLSGDVDNAATADKALRLAQGFVAKPEQVVNMLSVSESEQVMLKVRIVEVNRTIIKQLGFDLSAVTGQLGMPQYAFTKAPTYGVNGSYLGSATGGYSVNTTSQPVSGFPFANLFPGLSQASGLFQAAQSAGIGLSSIGTVVSQFLTGGSTLTAAQKTFSQNYLSGLIGNVSTQVTPNINATTAGVPYTVTASYAGINTGNIASLEQAYVSGSGSLTNDQRLWLNAFNTQLPSYNASAQYSVASGTDSTLVDRSNPANIVQNGRAGSTGLNQASSMLQAFERNGLVRTLAEPNLTAISGESAKFLVGGEFPVPVGEDSTGRITVDFKQYGVGLGFTPVVMSKGRISLKLSTEVSEVTNTGSFSVSNTSTSSTGVTTASPSLVIPGLNVRRAETVVELPSGQSMMIAGLLQSVSKETLDSLPGLMQVPVLGALFRSRDYQQGETELVIIVTPYLVKPVMPDQLQTPADGLQIANDLETNLLGKLNKSVGKTPPKDQTYQGPIGYVVE